MKRFLALALLAPTIVAARVDPNMEAVRALLAKISAGETLPEEVLDRQFGHSDLPDLDQSLAKAKGCVAGAIDPLQNGSFGVQWKCKGRKRKDMPSALIIKATGGQITKITTAVLM